MLVIVLVNGQLYEVDEVMDVPYVGEVVTIKEADFVVASSGVSEAPLRKDIMPIINLLPIGVCSGPGA